MKNFLSRCKGSILAALALCFIVLVYGPLELYFTNRKDFWFEPKVILPEVAFLFAVALVGCLALLAVINRFLPKLKPWLTGCFVWGVLVCYIHSNFLSGWLPSMDGKAVDWNAYPQQRILSIAVCLAVAVLVVLLAKKKWLEKVSLWGGSLLTAMLAVTLVVLGIGSSSSSAGQMYYSSAEGLQKYSTDKNFVIFVVDMVDGDTFESVVNESEEYQNALRDFTYYNNTLCAYPYTYYAVPQLLSGEWYEGGEIYDTFRSRCLRESPLFTRLQNENWQMGMYLDELIFDKNAEPERFYNLRWQASNIVSHSAFWRVILRMSCVKNAPFDFKRLGYSLPEKLNGLKYGNLYNTDTWFVYHNSNFLESCQQADSTQNGGKTDLCQDKMFKYIHVEGAHYPFQYGPHMENVEGTDQANYRNNVAGTVYMIGQYLDMLRNNGTYDNTAIVIMSDHGFAQDENGGEANEGRQHSIFLAKGFGESHDYAENAAPLSYDDLQTAFSRLLDGAQGDAVTDWKAGDQRERRYLNYLHQYTESDGKTVQTREINGEGFIEMIQTGLAGDCSTLKPSGNIYALPKTVWN